MEWNAQVSDELFKGSLQSELDQTLAQELAAEEGEKHPPEKSETGECAERLTTTRTCSCNATTCVTREHSEHEYCKTEGERCTHHEHCKTEGERCTHHEHCKRASGFGGEFEPRLSGWSQTPPPPLV